MVLFCTRRETGENQVDLWMSCACRARWWLQNRVDCAVERAEAPPPWVLSFANTLSRLVIGPLADMLAPSPTTIEVPHPTSDVNDTSRTHMIIWAFPRKQHLSRTLFLVCASVILALTFGWALVRMRSQADLWVLCIGVGVVYGSVFTVL